MNNTAITTLVCWQTRSHVIAKKAIQLCKDYGLKDLIRGCYLGTLKSREREQVETFFSKNFTRTTDRFTTISVNMYQVRGERVKEDQKLSNFQSFEII